MTHRLALTGRRHRCVVWYGAATTPGSPGSRGRSLSPPPVFVVCVDGDAMDELGVTSCAHARTCTHMHALARSRIVGRNPTALGKFVPWFHGYSRCLCTAPAPFILRPVDPRLTARNPVTQTGKRRAVRGEALIQVPSQGACAVVSVSTLKQQAREVQTRGNSLLG